jgi:multidrug efflux pump subunit AcrB
LARRGLTLCIFLIVCLGGLSLLCSFGEDFFPTARSAELKLHVRAPTGTRIEETARLCDRVEEIIKQAIPRGELESILDNIGVTLSGINLAHSTSGAVGTQDAEILISLNSKGVMRHNGRLADHIRRCLQEAFPEVEFHFQASDIISEILDFGLPAPIDIQVRGPDVDVCHHLAARLLPIVSRVPGIEDARIQQAFDQPSLRVAVDRVRIAKMGFTEQEVANEIVINLASNEEIAPSYWWDRKNLDLYEISARVPPGRIESIDHLLSLPVIGSTSSLGRIQTLSNIATVNRSVGPNVFSTYNGLPVVDIFVAPNGRDLGHVSDDLAKILSTFINRCVSVSS